MIYRAILQLLNSFKFLLSLTCKFLTPDKSETQNNVITNDFNTKLAVEFSSYKATKLIVSFQ